MIALVLVLGCTGEVQRCSSGLRYHDLDGDGVGSLEAIVPCAHWQPSLVDISGDCDDEDASAHPGAVERCNERDDDCDGSVDEEDASAHPGAVERCNERDDDCDGSVDEEAIDMSFWYLDEDGDGYGDEPAGRSCSPPWGKDYVTTSGDCDDDDPTYHPGALEWCDGDDIDCDGESDWDERVVDAAYWYPDQDRDGFGALAGGLWGCRWGSDWALKSGDCDDSEAAVHPGADELCDGVDQDCDGEIDEDPRDGYRWYVDEDGDGFGGAEVVDWTCEPTEPAEGLVPDHSDCDDSDPAVNPLAADVWYDGVDQDCDGHSDFDADYDGVDLGEDCDDSTATVSPELPEALGNGRDDDCDGDIDDCELREGLESCVSGLWWAPGWEEGWPNLGAVSWAAPGQSQAQLVAGGRGFEDADSTAGRVTWLGGIEPGIHAEREAAAWLGVDGLSSSGWSLWCPPVDLDGSGQPSLVFGQTSHGGGEGAVHVIGSAPSSRDAAIEEIAEAVVLLGSSGGLLLGPAGDLDGDGSEAFVESSSYWSKGPVRILAGPLSGSVAVEDAVVAWIEDDTEALVETHIENFLASPMDLDGDGLDDLLFSDPDGGGEGYDSGLIRG